MNKAQNGLNGHAANGMKQVLLDEKSESEAAEVLNSIRGHLPNLSGKSEEKIRQGVVNFLENKLKLTKVKVNVTEFEDEYRIYPHFSLDGSTTQTGTVTLKKQKVAVGV
jgi:hypothetical protein